VGMSLETVERANEKKLKTSDFHLIKYFIIKNNVTCEVSAAESETRVHKIVQLYVSNY
jgi:hypothetical protein